MTIDVDVSQTPARCSSMIAIPAASTASVPALPYPQYAEPVFVVVEGDALYQAASVAALVLASCPIMEI